MIEIPLTQDRIAIVDEIDAEWALGLNWCAVAISETWPDRLAV